MKKKHRILLLCNLLLFLTGYIQAQNFGRLTTRKLGKSAPEYEDCKNFRVTIGGGYAYWLGENQNTGNSSLNQFSSDLRHGYNLEAEAQYYFHEYMGVGLNTNFVKHSKDEMNRLGIKETDKMLFVGPTFNFRYESGKWGVYSGLGLGAIFYNGNVTLESAHATIKHTNFGLNYGISGEYKLNKTVGAGIKLSYTVGSFKIDNTDDKFSVSNLIITGFISFITK